MGQKIRAFLQESRQELKRVNWPTKDETIRYTLFVIVFSVLFAIFLGVLDYGFVYVLQDLVVG
ncbi:preprotein translocase subunit SecE [Candidatus Parcubacteria bacterium]|jgi:preprotein translocase subunit SecE|nr:MAG: preprotein translocase subunit SecE [Candidatus Parcubacteria bacterium]